MSALVMEKADGTLQGMQFGGEVLVRVAWALASTLAALNKVRFIHGDLKPGNVLWKVPLGGDILRGWPLLTDFGASQHFPSLQLGREELSPSAEVHTSQWTPKFAAPEVREKGGRLQTVRSDMFAWAATIRAVARKDVIEPTRAILESILEECSASDPEHRPRDFAEIAGRLEQPSYVMWGNGLQGVQQWLEGERLSNSNRTAAEAVTLLAQEREV
eukprot:3423989-Amphidinium_carterae.1